MDVKVMLNPGEDMSMENVCDTVEKHLEKINCFVACVISENFVSNASEEAVDEMLKSAVDIELTLSEDGNELKKTLKKLYPAFNFNCCGDLLLESILNQPEIDERIMLYAINKYVGIYSKDKLFNLLIKMLQTRRLKEEAINLILSLKNEGAAKMLGVKSIISLWEHMIAENYHNFENCVLETFNKETALFLQCLKLCGKSTGHLILTIILRYLDSQPDLKMWFVLLSTENIKTTSYLCSEYAEFLEGLLKFFKRYAALQDCHEGKAFSWTHNLYPLNEFVNILHFLLTHDGLVGITVNKFINKEISNFDRNCSFWIDIKALLK